MLTSKFVRGAVLAIGLLGFSGLAFAAPAPKKGSGSGSHHMGSGSGSHRGGKSAKGSGKGS